ncbi:GNAT family N-acetyltransferase [Halomarina ordinaria]|uniref:GNAT family N-acetyltransferase n=1 Tax=Halomarina ordinaria TaxID=3033939 RepID=A0ABD5U773_9EURY|nr:GNAT family N-acetyltransferase [Halomarina sp. PSRA2]
MSHGDDYTVRPYDGDREGYLDLYETVFGARKSREWFAWKYEDNPYADHVPIYVAQRDGEVVGARSFFGLELRAGERTYTTLEPCDTMVHPDHRRRGLFTRMTERAIERYADDGLDLFFDFPNEQSLPGNLKLGWRVVETVTTHYRVQHPGALAPVGEESLVGRALDAAGATAMDAYFGLRGRRVRRLGRDVTVSHYDGVPADHLCPLYESHVPKRFHANRDETFYGWRYDNPEYDYTTYLARRDGEVVGAAVVGESAAKGVANVLDVHPLTDRAANAPVYAALLRSLLQDVSAIPLVALRDGVVPPRVLSGFGFHPDTALPLSKLTEPATLVARPLEDEWTLDGRSLTDPRDWQVSICEKDTA